MWIIVVTETNKEEYKGTPYADVLVVLINTLPYTLCRTQGKELMMVSWQLEHYQLQFADLKALIAEPTAAFATNQPQQGK